MEKAQRKLSQEHGRTASISELSKETSLSVASIKKYKYYSQKTFSLDINVSGSGELQLVDILEDRRVLPEEYVFQENLKTRIKNAFLGLTHRERNVLSLRYGLNGEEALTAKNTAIALSISPSTVRKTEKSAIQKLRTQEIQQLATRLKH